MQSLNQKRFNFQISLQVFFVTEKQFVRECDMAYRFPFAKRHFQRYNKKENKDFNTVGFFAQFIRDFIRPYGRATKMQIASHSDFKWKLKGFTCEWMCRPSVARSESAATICDNIETFDDLNNLHKAQQHITVICSKYEKVAKSKLSYH